MKVELLISDILEPIYPIRNRRNGEIIKVNIKPLTEADSARLYILQDEKWGDTFFGWRTFINNSYHSTINVVTAIDDVAFGIYKYIPCDNYLFIDCMESVRRRDFNYIGLAIIADAIFMSMRLGFKGKIRLRSIVPKEGEKNPDEFYRSIEMEEETLPISVLNKYNFEEISTLPKTFHFKENRAKEYLEKYEEFSQIMRLGVKWSEFNKRYEQLKSEQETYFKLLHNNHLH